MPAYATEMAESNQQQQQQQIASGRSAKVYPTVELKPGLLLISSAEDLKKQEDDPCSQSPSASWNSAAADSETGAEERKTDWRSIYLCTAITFCCQVQFALFLNSQFAFMKTLDPSITEGFFGLVVGGYSLVQMLFTPLMGVWAHRLEQVRLPLLVSNGIMLAGNVLYFLVGCFPNSWSKYVFLVARLISGVGPTQNSLVISYASSASVDKDRANATAFITGGIAIGITMGPAFQWLFTYMDYPGLHLVGDLHLNMFTAPALFAILMNAILHFLLQFFFNESYVGIMQRKKVGLKNVASETTIQLQQKLPPYDRLAIGVCCALRFTQYLTFTNLETIGTSFSMMMFSWSSTEVVTYESFAHTARGMLTLLVYVAYIVFNLGRRVNERMVCLLSLGMVLAFHLITFSWPFFSDEVARYDSTNQSMPQLGCDRHSNDWCTGLKAVHVWVYYASIVLFIGIAFPNMYVTMNTLFSRIIGPRMQSKEQSLMEMFGGLGRMLGPSVFGVLYTKYGPRPIWIVEAIEVGLMILLWMLCWNRLVPLKIPKEIEGPKVEKKMEQITRASFAGNLPR